MGRYHPTDAACIALRWLPEGSGRLPNESRITLIEVLVALVITALVVGGMMTSIIMASESTRTAAQHTAAMQLCVELVEEMRSVEFEQLVPANYPLQPSVTLMAPKSGDNTILCTRSVELTDADTEDIEARRVVVKVEWRAGNRPQKVKYETIIYRFH